MRHENDYKLSNFPQITHSAISRRLLLRASAAVPASGAITTLDNAQAIGYNPPAF